MKKIAALLLAVALAGCTAAEVDDAHLAAWDSFYQAVKDDLVDYYTRRDEHGRYIGDSVLPPRSAENRLGLLDDEEASIKAARARLAR